MEWLYLLYWYWSTQMVNLSRNPLLIPGFSEIQDSLQINIYDTPPMRTGSAHLSMCLDRIDPHTTFLTSCLLIYLLYFQGDQSGIHSLFWSSILVLQQLCEDAERKGQAKIMQWDSEWLVIWTQISQEQKKIPAGSDLCSILSRILSHTAANQFFPKVSNRALEADVFPCCCILALVSRYLMPLNVQVPFFRYG